MHNAEEKCGVYHNSRYDSYGTGDGTAEAQLCVCGNMEITGESSGMLHERLIKMTLRSISGFPLRKTE